jgi:hypothetical protein
VVYSIVACELSVSFLEHSGQCSSFPFFTSSVSRDGTSSVACSSRTYIVMAHVLGSCNQVYQEDLNANIGVTVNYMICRYKQ